MIMEYRVGTPAKKKDSLKPLYIKIQCWMQTKFFYQVVLIDNKQQLL